MSRVVLTPEAARTALGAVIRYELREAWERGLATPPRGVNSLADAGASQSYDAIMTAADDLGTAIVALWRGARGCPPTPGGDVSRETSPSDDGQAGARQAPGRE